MPIDPQARLRKLLAYEKSISTALQLGLITPEELAAHGSLLEFDEQQRVVARGTATADLGAAASEARTRMFERLGALADGRLGLYAADPDGMFVGLGKGAARTFMQTAASMQAGALDLAALMNEGLPGSVPGGVFGVQFDSESLRATARGLKAGYDDLTGLYSEDAIMSDLVRHNEGIGGVVGEAGAALWLNFAALGATGGLSAAATTASGASRIGGWLGKTLIGGTKKVAVAKGLAGLSFIAGVMGYGVDPTKETPEDTLDRLTMGLANAGGVLLLGTALMGRPSGATVQALRNGELLTAGKLGIPDLWHLATKVTPQLTVGNMLRAGAVGAGFEAVMNMNAGMGSGEAVGRGVVGGLQFVGWDVAFTRLGALRRVMGAQAAASGRAGAYLAAFGVPPAVLATGAGGVAGISYLTDGDSDISTAALGGAAAGLVVGASAALRPGTLARRVRKALMPPIAAKSLADQPEALAAVRKIALVEAKSVLPDDLVEHLAVKGLEGLKPEDAAVVAQWLTSKSWREGLMSVVDREATPAADVVGNIFRQAVDADTTLGAEAMYGMLEMNLILQRLTALEAANPATVTEEMVALYGRYGILRDKVNAATVKFNVVEPVVTASGRVLSKREGRARFRDASRRVAASVTEAADKPSVVVGETTAEAIDAALPPIAAADRSPTLKFRDAVDEYASLTGVSRARAVHTTLASRSPGDPNGATWVSTQVAGIKNGSIKVEVPQAPTPAVIPALESGASRALAIDEFERLEGVDTGFGSIKGLVEPHLGTTATVTRRGSDIIVEAPGFARVRAPNARTLFRRLKERIGGTVLAAGPVLPGFSLSRNDDEGDGRVDAAWTASLAGVAALAALGIVVPQGRAVRMSTMLKLVQEAVETTARRGRELSVVLREGGEVVTILGGSKSVLPARSRGTVVKLDWHGHPPASLALPDTTEAERAIVDNLATLPSRQDILSIALEKDHPPVLGVLSTAGHSDTVTLYKIPAGYRKRLDERGLSMVGAAQATGDPNLVLRAFATSGVSVWPGVKLADLDSIVARELRNELADPLDYLAASWVEPGISDSDVFTAIGRDWSLPKLRGFLAELFETKVGEPIEAAARRVAPAGAGRVRRPLAATITPDDIASAPKQVRTVADEHNLRTWLDARGMELHIPRDVDGTLQYQFRLKDSSKAIIAQASELNVAYRQLVETSAQRGIGSAEAVMFGLPGGMVGGVLGSIAGSLIQRWAGEDRVESTALGTYGGLLIGGILGSLLSVKSFSKLSRRGLQALTNTYKLDVPLINDATARAHPEFKQKGLGMKDWWRFPLAAKVDHLTARLETVGRTKEAKPDRIKHLQRTLRKYTLLEIDAPSVERVRAATYEAGRRAEMDPVEIDRLWRGYLFQVGSSPEDRLRLAHRNLFELNKPPSGLAGGIGSLSTTQLRDNLLLAKVIVGPGVEASAAYKLKKTIGHRVTTQIDDAAKEMGAMVEALRVSDTERRLATDPQSTPSFLWSSPIGRLRPPEGYRSRAQWLRQNGDPVTADTIERVYTRIKETQDTMEDDMRDALRKGRDLRRGLTKGDMAIIRTLLEPVGTSTPASARAALAGKNDALIKRAEKIKAFLHFYGPERLQMAEQDVYEEYFAHFYSQRTIREIRESGGRLMTEEPMTLPGHGFSAQKFFRAAMRRSTEEPLGDVLPLDEMMDFYTYGAVRKYHLDRMAETVKGVDLRTIAAREPFIARRMTQWLLDIHGIPTEQELATKAIFNGMGLKIDEIADSLGLDSTSFARSVADYLQDKADPSAFSYTIRGLEAFAKLAFSAISALVNLSQIANTGAELGLTNLFVGTVDVSRGYVAAGLEKRAGVVGEIINGFIDPNARGRQVYRLAREQGILAPELPKYMDDMVAKGMFVDREHVVRDSLRLATSIGLKPFQWAETVNRSISAGAAAAAVRSAGKEGSGRVGQFVSDVAIGGIAGAATGEQLFGEEGDEGRAATIGAVVGGVLGAASGSGASIRDQVRGRLETITGMRGGITDVLDPTTRKFVVKELTQDEITKLYMQQVVEMTQFKFSRASRPELLRHPVGEIAFTLQSYTLNQAEFLGHRMAAMVGSAGGDGPLDTRFLRYLTFWFGAGAALTAVGGFSDQYDRGPQYWMARLGFGLFPFMSYNVNAKEWQINDPYDTLGRGPFISDVWRAAQTINRLATDPEALSAFDRQLDNLSRNVVVAIRMSETYGDWAATGFEALGAESAADWAQTIGRIGSRPLQSMRAGRAVGAEGSASPTRRRETGFGESGFDGRDQGFGGGGFE